MGTHNGINCSTVTYLAKIKDLLCSIASITCIATHKESLESPLVPNNLILNETIGTAWHSIDSIVATHDAGNVALSHTGLECWEVSLCKNQAIDH